MNIFRYLLCFLFFGHDKERIVADDIENRLCLLECGRCHRHSFEQMPFDRWWHLIDEDERKRFFDGYRDDSHWNK